jgi:amino acid transporter
LARDRLGVPAVVFFVMSGIAPLTVAAGVIPTAYAVTGLIAIPAAFIAVAVILGFFSVGYVAMARQIKNAGAFYAFVARGLGRPVGVGAALVAVVGYNCLQVGLYGAFGPGAASFAADKFHVHAPWWAWALGAWIVVTILGLLHVEVTGRVLAALLSVEVLVTIALTISGLLHPANHHVSLATLEPTKLAVSGVGAALAVAVLGYVGFETAAVLTEEAKNARRTIATATYLSLGCIAVVYAGASWAMAVHYGDSDVVGVAQQQGPGMMFALGNAFLSNAGQTLYLTSLFAAMLAFHSFVTRYMFALGREGVLPRALGITSRQGSPKVASGLQSALGLGVILVYASVGWDPLVKLFFWLGTTGGFGILVLVATTSVAVIAYFVRHPGLESLWHRVLAPTVASLALFAVVWLVIDNYATLLGVPPGSAAATWLPATFGFAGGIGVVWALVLRAGNPDVYQTIGLGADAATGHIKPLAVLDPHWSQVEL